MTQQPITDCSAVILAGGKNSRYGGFHKAFLRIDDEFIIEKDLRLLRPLFSKTFVVANNPELFNGFDVDVFPDIYRDRGPLACIHSALKHSQTSSVMIFGCDMPFLDKEMIVKMYETFKKSGKDYCIPRSGGFIEPLHAFYSRNILNELENHLDNNSGNAVKKFLENKDICYMETEIKQKTFFIINSPDDLLKIAQ